MARINPLPREFLKPRLPLARRAAALLARRYGIPRLPVCPAVAARALGYGIARRPRLPEDAAVDPIRGDLDLCGFVDPASRTITLIDAPDHDPTLLRFTLAHEVGHILLHVGAHPFGIPSHHLEDPAPSPGQYPAEDEPGLQALVILMGLFHGGKGVPRYRAWKNRDAVLAVHEWEADEFARELLMPLDRLRSLGRAALNADQVACDFRVPPGEARRQVQTHLSRLLRHLDRKEKPA